MMIRQCWGIHNNGCTNVAEYDSIFCEACAKEYWEACERAEKASRKPQRRLSGDFQRNTGKEAQEA